MKTSIRWTILFVLSGLIAAFFVENRDLRVLVVTVAFWSSLICELLDNKNKRDELRDSEESEDSDGFY